MHRVIHTASGLKYQEINSKSKGSSGITRHHGIEVVFATPGAQLTVDLDTASPLTEVWAPTSDYSSSIYLDSWGMPPLPGCLVVPRVCDSAREVGSDRADSMSVSTCTGNYSSGREPMTSSFMGKQNHCILVWWFLVQTHVETVYAAWGPGVMIITLLVSGEVEVDYVQCFSESRRPHIISWRTRFLISILILVLPIISVSCFPPHTCSRTKVCTRLGWCSILPAKWVISAESTETFQNTIPQYFPIRLISACTIAKRW